MVQGNIVRYDEGGNIKWFGKRQEEELSKFNVEKWHEVEEKKRDEVREEKKGDDWLMMQRK